MLQIIHLFMAMSLALACCAFSDMQLVQISMQASKHSVAIKRPRPQCRTVVEGDECYKEVKWVMQTGIVEHPDRYLPLTSNSSLEDFQQHLHGVARLSQICPEPCLPQKSEKRLPASYATPAPALRVGTPMPTEIHMDDLMNSEYPGYERSGGNCSCGNPIRQFSEEYPSLEQCAEECNLYPHCKSIGLHPWQSIWRGHCDLYDAVCNDTDGHAENTTCTNPTPMTAFSVVFNRVPTNAPTPAPTASPDPCDVNDGSAPSSFYPCSCGPDICLTNELCSGELCAPPMYLKVEWPCTQVHIGSPYFTLWGTSDSEAPIYKNEQDNYLYWDASCDGLERIEKDKRPRWIIDDDRPIPASVWDLDGDGECSYFGHHGSAEYAGVPLGSHSWLLACPTQVNMTVTITFQREPPTPAPTLPPGAPCTCESQSCGIFAYIDIDGDGCLNEIEVDLIVELRGHFLDMDLDHNGCCNKTECAISPYSADLPLFPIRGPAECDYGYYFMEGTSVCQECTTGETRRRRSTACSACPVDKEDLGEFDNCIGGVYLTSPVTVGSDLVFINKDTDESGVLLQIGDGITMSTRNPGHYERMIITNKVGFDDSARLSPSQESLLRTRGPFFMLDHGVHAEFNKFDAIVSACTGVNGIDLSGQYPCGCGIEICDSGFKCDELCGKNQTVLNPKLGLSYGSSGCCIGPPVSPLPSPAPTVSAKGDPHIVNLQGEHFDVNNEGEFTMLRIPQAADKPAEMELRATIRSEYGKPCTTYITEVEFSGAWFGDKLVQVRSYLKSHFRNESDKFLGVRVLSRTMQNDAPWENIVDRTNADRVLHEQTEQNGFKLILSKSQWYSKKNSKAGDPTVAGQFMVQMQNKKSAQTAVIIVRQDLPGQEHLNLAVRRLSVLGRADVGGLLGFDEHPGSLEDVTPECQRHRNGLDDKRGPHSKPGWKTRWEKIKQQRSEKRASGEKMNDNEASASLETRDLMCVCPGEASSGLTEEETGDQLISGAVEGVVADFQTGRMAEATWD